MNGSLTIAEVHHDIPIKDLNGDGQISIYELVLSIVLFMIGICSSVIVSRYL